MERNNIEPVPHIIVKFPVKEDFEDVLEALFLKFFTSCRKIFV